jgi:transposase
MNSLDTLVGLLPIHSGLEIEKIAITPETSSLEVRTTAGTACCPQCGQSSGRVHSRYQRKLADLPWQGRIVTIRLQARRFFCATTTCAQQIFVERIPQAAKVYARSTIRLSQAHGQIGLALGGEAGARLATHLAMPTSPDTLLRRTKQSPLPTAPLPRIVGIDEWAWRKGQRYGTIVVDLERGRVFDLLPDHERKTLQSWLKQHPQVELVSRDRSGTIAQAVAAAAPQAKQVADRWHLLKNLRDCVERVFQRTYGSIKAVLAPSQPVVPEAKPVSPGDTVYPVKSAWLSRREQKRQTRRAYRVERFEEVRQLHRDGHPILRIAKIMGMGRETVRRYVRSERCPDWNPGGRFNSGRTFPVRLDGFRQSVDRLLHEGCRNAAAIHRALLAEGQSVSYYAVRRFVRHRLLSLGVPRPADRERHAQPNLPSARTLAFSLLRKAESREAEEQNQLQAIKGASLELKAAMELTDEFAAMTRKTLAQPLPLWLEKAEQSCCQEIRGFARSLRRDEAAVAAALHERWSNGPVEGAINRLKSLKRQMYGRAGFELLRARVLNAA